MVIALISLISLLAVIVLSCVNQKLNPGLLALLAAMSIGFFSGAVKVDAIIDFFPARLFVLLLSMSLVFGTAQINGSLEKLTQRAVYLIKGQQRLLPLLIFFLAFVLSAVGPGNIVATAVLAPMAMLLAKKHKVSELVMAIMLCTGANAGAFSPFAPTGVITVGLLESIAVSTSLIWIVFAASAGLQSVSALFAYGIFLLRTQKRLRIMTQSVSETKNGIGTIEKLTSKQKITLLLITALLAGVLVLKIPLTLMAVLVTVCMFAFNLADEQEVLETVPWSTIIMVSGIAILIGLMEKTGGLTLATDFIAKVTSAGSINAALAFITGLISAYSSSSGVVLPAFLPLLPGLAATMNIENITPMIIAVAVGSHMVDVSPLSTLGALSIAAVSEKEVRSRMFNYLLIWGMAMSVVAAILAYVFLDILL